MLMGGSKAEQTNTGHRDVKVKQEIDKHGKNDDQK